MIIFAICWAGQIVEAFLPVAFPASVISMVLMVILYLAKILKVSQVEETSNFFTSNMAIFFVPVSVGLMNYINVIWDNALAFFTVVFVSLVLTFGATSTTVVLVNKLMAKKGGK